MIYILVTRIGANPFCTYSVTYTFLVFPFTQKTKNLLFFLFRSKLVYLYQF